VKTQVLSGEQKGVPSTQKKKPECQPLCYGCLMPAGFPKKGGEPRGVPRKALARKTQQWSRRGAGIGRLREAMRKSVKGGRSRSCVNTRGGGKKNNNGWVPAGL